MSHQDLVTRVADQHIAGGASLSRTKMAAGWTIQNWSWGSFVSIDTCVKALHTLQENLDHLEDMLREQDHQSGRDIQRAKRDIDEMVLKLESFKNLEGVALQKHAVAGPNARPHDVGRHLRGSVYGGDQLPIQAVVSMGRYSSALRKYDVYITSDPHRVNGPQVVLDGLDVVGWIQLTSFMRDNGPYRMGGGLDYAIDNADDVRKVIREYLANNAPVIMIDADDFKSLSHDFAVAWTRGDPATLLRKKLIAVLSGAGPFVSNLFGEQAGGELAAKVWSLRQKN